tara:strand:- start:355 stop:972 length:618 start_codon:yes stop_codon:yes gene_type:complete
MRSGGGGRKRARMRKLGYLRVSTADQRPDRQVDGLQAICDALYVEHASASGPRRPVFDQVMAELQPGDMFVVWDLDRAFRSAIDALTALDRLRARGVSMRIVNLQLDTSTPSGLLVYTVISAIAEFERRILSQRTKEGLAAAKRRGRRLGRPPKLTDEALREARRKLRAGPATVTDLAAELGVAPWSLSRALKRQEAQAASTDDP